jgi:hypothetical protein
MTESFEQHNRTVTADRVEIARRARPNDATERRRQNERRRD